MINEQLSFEDYKIKILKENVYVLQEQLNKSYIRIKELIHELNLYKTPPDYWDDSLSYIRWYDKHHNDI
tara:strand:- start:1267 stop:1473 length:207 start_codon:yes stop_codon:yes gene_type:complete